MSTIPTLQAPAQETLTPDQQSALKRLHQATQQFEGVFLGLLFKEMRATVPQEGLFGKDSQTTLRKASMQKAEEIFKKHSKNKEKRGRGN